MFVQATLYLLWKLLNKIPNISQCTLVYQTLLFEGLVPRLQASNMHMHVCNAVPLVLGLLRLTQLGTHYICCWRNIQYTYLAIRYTRLATS